MIARNLPEKTVAIVRRDLLTAFRTRSAPAMNGAAALLQLAAFYYLAQAIGPGFRPAGFEYFPFVLIGTGLYTFLIAGINSFLQAVKEAQQAGTLEVLMATSTPPRVLVLLGAFSSFGGNSVLFVLYVGMGLLMAKVSLSAISFTGFALIFLLSVLIAVALGMLAAALQVAFHKGSAVIWLFGSGAWLLTGTLFPVEALPRPLQFVAELLPTTHSLNGMRSALLQGSVHFSWISEASILAVFCIVLLPVGWMVFSAALRHARLEGSLSYY